MYILDGVEQIARQTIEQVNAIRRMHKETKYKIQQKLPKIYSHELLDSLFLHPYTKIEYIQNNLGISRQTACKYLEQLVQIGILSSHKSGKYNYYINQELFKLLSGS